MKQGNERSATWIWLMLGYSLALLAVSLPVGSIQENINGLIDLCTAPAQLTTDYFAVSCIGGTLLNAGLIGLLCCGVLILSKASVNATSLMAYFLSVGFAFFGLNVCNVWPGMLGVWVYTKLRRRSLAQYAHIAIFSTALAPFVSELLYRYPLFEAGWLRVFLAVGLGVINGMILPMLIPYSSKLHKNYTLYNAALPVGVLGILWYVLLFPGMEISISPGAQLGQAQPLFAWAVYGGSAFALLLIGWIANGCSLRGYGNILRCTGYEQDLTETADYPVVLIHMGVYGFFVIGCYQLIGASFNGVTIGCMFCLMAVAARGATPVTMLPILLGYILASVLIPLPLHTQSLVTGLCFAAALVPVSGKCGVICGVLAGLLHGCLVRPAMLLHGGFCLYNGGLTSGIVAMMLAAILPQTSKQRKTKSRFSGQD